MLLTNLHVASLRLSFPFVQLFELSTGKEIKNPPLQTIRETSSFGIDEEGRWVYKGAKATDWDKDALQPKVTAG